MTVSAARAGNVIGGGDFATDRIVRETALRAAKLSGTPIQVRNPHSTRPYQHVLEPLYASVLIAACQYEDSTFEGYYNVGPGDEDCVTTGELTELFCQS